MRMSLPFLMIAVRNADPSSSRTQVDVDRTDAGDLAHLTGGRTPAHERAVIHDHVHRRAGPPSMTAAEPPRRRARSRRAHPRRTPRVLVLGSSLAGAVDALYLRFDRSHHRTAGFRCEPEPSCHHSLGVGPRPPLPLRTMSLRPLGGILDTRASRDARFLHRDQPALRHLQQMLLAPRVRDRGPVGDQLCRARRQSSFSHREIGCRQVGELASRSRSPSAPLRCSRRASRATDAVATDRRAAFPVRHAFAAFANMPSTTRRIAPNSSIAPHRLERRQLRRVEVTREHRREYGERKRAKRTCVRTLTAR